MVNNMKYLSGKEEKNAQTYIEEAKKVAQSAMCERAKCGAVIVNSGEIIGKVIKGESDWIGFNNKNIIIVVETYTLTADKYDLEYNKEGNNIAHLKVTGAIGAIIWPNIQGLSNMSNSGAIYTAQPVLPGRGNILNTITIFFNIIKAV